MQTGNGIEINGEKKDYDLTSINNGPNVSTNSDNINNSLEEVNTNVVEPQQPAVEQSTLDQVNDSVNTESNPVAQDTATTQQDSSNPLNQISQFVKTNIDTTNISKEIKDPKNKKIIIIFGVIIAAVLFLGVVIYFISSLTNRVDLTGTYGCNSLENSWRDTYEEYVVINKNKTMQLGVYDDFENNHYSGTYSYKKFKGSKKGTQDLTFNINEDVDNGKSQKHSGVIRVYITKWKNGKYDFIYSKGESMVCVKGVKLKNNKTTTTEATTTTTSVDPKSKMDLLASLFSADKSDENTISSTVFIKQGTIKKGDDVQIVGAGKVINAKVKSIKNFWSNEEMETAYYGQEENERNRVKLFFENVELNDLKQGMAIIKPNSQKTSKKYKVKLKLSRECAKDNFTDYTSEETFKFTNNFIETTGKIVRPENVSLTELCSEPHETIIELDEDYILFDDTTIIKKEGTSVNYADATIIEKIEE